MCAYDYMSFSRCALSASLSSHSLLFEYLLLSVARCSSKTISNYLARFVPVALSFLVSVGLFYLISRQTHGVIRTCTSVNKSRDYGKAEERLLSRDMPRLLSVAQAEFPHTFSATAFPHSLQGRRNGNALEEAAMEVPWNGSDDDVRSVARIITASFLSPQQSTPPTASASSQQSRQSLCMG
ncbi:hypothetical protein ABB37_03807 [Leptomonas pyrrhocoris]|uniref:Transmembrane protein n=1 Tax=Leptomonas pyrrhocoris TaxID=157538 RepID=A0A0M9G3J9_LEPPY|nr:hypothetical protein ABB37_03807 [Leptomonas pyrrhocoris]KPA81439.1 hypothetical protein ABB37_03807 [Leptomonas pyrrhocoris]|eukprot:XP_015659878.1 hypothetical protein ABB37_03807 [Leptomonas pyrrhocoris]